MWSEGFGFTDDSKRVKVTGATLFEVQSISKVYTATAFLRAVEKHWFKLDDRLINYLPNFKVKSRQHALLTRTQSSQTQRTDDTNPGHP